MESIYGASAVSGACVMGLTDVPGRSGSMMPGQRSVFFVSQGARPLC